jgi:hypothetical protein
MAFANVFVNELLKHAFKIGAGMTRPTTIKVALSTTDPGADGSGITEPSGNGYARVTNNNWSQNVAKSIENTADVAFPQATGSWGTISHFAIYFDNVFQAGDVIRDSGGNTTTKVVGIDDILTFAAGQLKVSGS